MKTLLVYRKILKIRYEISRPTATNNSNQQQQPTATTATTATNNSNNSNQQQQQPTMSRNTNNNNVQKSTTKVVREVTDDGIQWNCYLEARKETSETDRDRVYKVVIGPRGQGAAALRGALKQKSVENQRTNRYKGNEDLPTYFGDVMIRAYCPDGKGGYERVERNTEETSMVFISTDSKWATTWLRTKVLTDLKWATNKCTGATSRPCRLVKVPDEFVGHVIGKRGSKLLRMVEKQQIEFRGSRKLYVNPAAHYDKAMGGFMLAANTELALRRLELEVSDAVTAAKNETWKKKKGKKTSGGGGGSKRTAATNMFAGLSDGYSSSEEE